MAQAVRYLRLVETPAAAEPEPQPQLWQVWAAAHWHVSWSIARAMYDAWDRAMRGER